MFGFLTFLGFGCSAQPAAAKRAGGAGVSRGSESDRRIMDIDAVIAHGDGRIDSGFDTSGREALVEERKVEEVPVIVMMEAADPRRRSS